MRQTYARGALAMVAIALMVWGLSACGSSGSKKAAAAPASTAAPATATATATATSTTTTAGAPVAATATEEISDSGVSSTSSFCGTKKITLGIHDGFGINAWSQESLTAVRSEAAKCPNVKTVVAIGGGDLQKSISDVNSMVAQGVDALVLIPDFGQAQLASIKAATQAGVKVVPWGADPTGTPGTDYVAYVDWSAPDSGTRWANWMVQALHGKGNVAFTGGPAGNPVGAEQLAAIVKVFKAHPGMKLITGSKEWPVTNWDPATAQKVTSALLAKEPKIDGIISNYGTDALASVRAFQAANRKLPAIASEDANGLSCIYKKAHLPLATISSRNWLGRVAARKAIAAAEGVTDSEPDTYDLPFFEDSLHGKPIQCSSSAAPDFYASNKIDAASIAKFGKP
jgi:ribose transport system substrate-binding protein